MAFPGSPQPTKTGRRDTRPGLQGGSKLPHSKVLRTVWALGYEECRRCLRARFARLGMR